jgi:hypothetical protein
MCIAVWMEYMHSDRAKAGVCVWGGGALVMVGTYASMLALTTMQELNAAPNARRSTEPAAAAATPRSDKGTRSGYVLRVNVELEPSVALVIVTFSWVARNGNRSKKAL